MDSDTVKRQADAFLDLANAWRAVATAMYALAQVQAAFEQGQATTAQLEVAADRVIGRFGRLAKAQEAAPVQTVVGSRVIQ